MCSAAKRRRGGRGAAIAAVTADARRCCCVACIGIVIVHLGAGALTLWHNYTTIRVGQSMVNDLRGDLYAHLQRLSLAYHSRQRVGDLMYRITADSFAVQTMIMNGVLPILSALILLAGMLIVLLPIDPLLTLLSLTIVPAAVRADRRLQPQDRRRRDRGARRSTAGSIRSSSGRCAAIKVVQAFTKEEEEHRRFMGASRDSLRRDAAALQLADALFGRRQRRDRRRHRAGRLCRRALGAVGQPVARPADRLHLLPGAALRPDQPDHPELGPDRRRAGRRRAASSRCSRPKPISRDGPRKFPPQGARGDIEWRGVSFRYRAETPVLRRHRPARRGRA